MDNVGLSFWKRRVPKFPISRGIQLKPSIWRWISVVLLEIIFSGVTPPLESLLIHIFSLAEASHPVDLRDPKGHPTIWKNAGPAAVAALPWTLCFGWFSDRCWPLGPCQVAGLDVRPCKWTMRPRPVAGKGHQDASQDRENTRTNDCLIEMLQHIWDDRKVHTCRLPESPGSSSFFLGRWWRWWSSLQDTMSLTSYVLEMRGSHSSLILLSGANKHGWDGCSAAQSFYFLAISILLDTSAHGALWVWSPKL